MASRSIDAGSSSAASSSGLGKAPAIFLSHSGKQKAFVEHLYDALRKVNHEPFFDKHSLPKGSPFPPHIKTAASQCTLGVVVLSDDFLTSKWPMIELEILVNQRGENAKLLPLFYKTTTMDLKSPMNRTSWQNKWEKELHQEPEVVMKWGKAVNALHTFNGEIFTDGSSEIKYIVRVVKTICKLVPCRLPHDLPEVEGCHRLAEEVVQRFELVCPAQQVTEARMVGLYGVGGVGKSTICQVLVNFFWIDYLGKSYHLKFPSNINNMNHEFLAKCKNMLKTLVDLDENLLSEVENIDQVVALMKERLVEHHVFLAIDNVWASFQEIVGRILKVDFSPGSKILVMSRSADLLKDLFQGQENHVVPLPAPDRDEAFRIFQKACALGDLNSLVREKHLLDGALEKCKFHGSYHALALKALGLLVKKACKSAGSQDLSRTLIEIKNIDLPEGVSDVLERSYDSLEELTKRMFLDIAVLWVMWVSWPERTVEKVRQWLSVLYEGQLPKGGVVTNLNVAISDLGLGGLLQFETGKDGEKIIVVHDLLRDLAVKKAANSCRFFIAESMCGRAVQEIEWHNLGRVIMNGIWKDKVLKPQFIEQLQRQECQKLQILHASQVGFLEGIDLHRMSALCVLKLEDVSVKSFTNWPSGLTVLVLRNVHESRSEEVGGLSSSVEEVDVRNCRLWDRAIDFCGLAHLMKLKNFERERVGTLELPDMSQLTCLEILEICECESLERIGDLTALTRLDSLILKRNRSMKEVGSLSSNLRCVEIDGCGVLKRLADMSGLTRLERLTISDCGSLEKVDGLSSNLSRVKIDGCGVLKRLPDMSRCTRLEELTISRCQSLETVDGLSSNLILLMIEECEALERLPGISGLTRLEILEIRHCRLLGEVGDLSSNSNLVRVCFQCCDNLKMVLDIRGLFRLRCLNLWRNRSQPVTVQCAFNSLTEFHILNCGPE